MHGSYWDITGMINKHWLQAHLGPGEHHTLRSDKRDLEHLAAGEHADEQGSSIDHHDDTMMISCRAWRKHC